MPIDDKQRLVKAPVYQQLNELLRELVRGGEFNNGERFLTERQVAERFGVSRATANKALSNLVSEGLLEFRKGLGTFVQGGVLDFDLKLLVSFTARARALGKEASTKVLRLDRVRARDLERDEPGSDGREAFDRLGLAAGDDLFFLERLRLADGVPVIYERRYVAARFCPDLDRTQAAGSLYALWTDRYKLEIGGADQTIRAVSIRGPEAKTLEVPAGVAGLLVTAVGQLVGGVPLWWERTLYRGDLYEFQNRIGPVQGSRPASVVLRAVGDARTEG